MSTAITLDINGRTVAGEAEPRTHLADFLREELLLTGTHLGCEQGVCGACTVFVDGRPVRACLTLAHACDGQSVRTVEGFDDDALMARLRDAFKTHHGLQCGFCTPGMLATAYDIVRRLPQADTARIRRELSGNLCRCTGYHGIVAAIEAVLAEGPPPAALVPTAHRSRMPREAPADVPAPERTAAVADGPASVLKPFAAYPAADALTGEATLARSITIDAPCEAVWAMVENPKTIAAAIPGAHLDALGEDGTLRGHLEVALGPMRARFAGVGAMRLDPAGRQGELRGEGQDRLSRTGLAAALAFTLAPREDGGTQLSFTATYALNGPLAQFGRPALVAAAADRILEEAIASIARRARGEEAAPAPRRLGGFALLVGIVRDAFARALRGRRP